MRLDLTLNELTRDLWAEYVYRDEDPGHCKVSFEKIREQLDFEPIHRVPDGTDEIVVALDEERFRDPFDGRYSNI